jgi:NAD(P)H dehydrogenase (quinone)
MKLAVILAHPKAGSFCASIAHTCVEALEAQGHAVVFSDLYAMDFDPRLQAGEIPVSSGFSAGADVVAERVRLAGADGFIFVYPFWFNAPPAMLKGYVDRVFGMGFGYGPTGAGGNQPLLAGRRLLSISTSGAPDHWVNSTGALKGLMEMFDYHLAGVCGLKVVDHVHFGGILSTLTSDAAQGLLEQVRTTLKRDFPAEAGQGQSTLSV